VARLSGDAVSKDMDDYLKKWAMEPMPTNEEIARWMNMNNDEILGMSIGDWYRLIYRYQYSCPRAMNEVGCRIEEAARDRFNIL
jgi:hypothetical protein